MSKRYESARGIYKVVVDNDKPFITIKDPKDGQYHTMIYTTIDTVEDLKDLFVAIASVLNQVYGDEQFN